MPSDLERETLQRLEALFKSSSDPLVRAFAGEILLIHTRLINMTHEMEAQTSVLRSIRKKMGA